MGANTLMNHTSGDRNVAVGQNAFMQNTSGSDNTAIGSFAGDNNLTGSGNVFIGAYAGFGETGSNKLYITSGSSNQLLYGDFLTGDLSLGQISGTVTILNDLSVTDSLYIGSEALTNNGGTLEWDGVALDGSSTFTGGTVADATTFSSDVNFSSDLYVSGMSYLANTTISGALDVAGAVNLSDRFTVYGPTILYDTLIVDGAAVFNNDLYVNGITSLAGSLNVSGYTTLDYASATNLALGSITDVESEINTNTSSISTNSTYLAPTILI